MKFAIAMIAMLAAGPLAVTAPPAAVLAPLSDGHDAVGMDLAPGRAAAAVVSLEFDNGSKQLVTIAARPQSARCRAPGPPGTKPSYREVSADDSLVSISPLGLRVFTRPNLSRYTDAQQQERLARWESLPPASRTPVHYEFRVAASRPPSSAGKVEVWINGSYAGVLPAAGILKQVRVALPTDGVLSEARSYRLPASDPKYCALDIRRIAKPGAMREAKLSLPPGPRQLEGVPLLLSDGSGSGDLGVVREMKGSWALECDEHLSRTPFDGMPETLHFSVPLAFYQKAYVLCTAEPDTDKERVLTVRMTRFARSGRGGAIVHAGVTLPGEGQTPSEGLKPVGIVSYTAQEKKIETPLYLAEIPLDPGPILDLLDIEKDPHAAMLDGRYLDIDLLGRIEGVKPAKGVKSGVHVFAITLERAPVSLALKPSQPGNIFHNDEVPQTTAVVRASRPCEAVLAWQIRDVAGTLIGEGSKTFRFNSPGQEQQGITLSAPRPGWYSLRLALGPPARPFLVHPAAFAVLGVDRRKAGYESPYGIWWFGRAHYGTDDPAVIGPMLFKAGMRKTTFGWTKYTEADFAPWKVTQNQIGWIFKPEDREGSAARVAQWMKDFPHCRSILIFHESYRNYLPAELFGEKPQEDSQTVAKARERVKIATTAAELYRQRFPDLKIILGNTSASAAIVASLLRHGFDPRLADYLGIETAAGQTGMPEKLWEGGPQGAYLTRDVARRLGCSLPVTGCYEYTARTTRNLGAGRQAEFYVRDVLMAHAYNYQHISPGLLYDAGNAYFHTLWGAGGVCERYPLLYAKPAYVALAAVTAALDQVKFRRKVPTGSLAVYALEFDRADGRRSYALWTPRAEVEMQLDFPLDARLEHTDFYGAVSQPSLHGERLRLPVGPAPQYLTSSRPISALRVVRQITEPVPEGFQVADPLDDASLWTLASDESLTKTTGELPRHVPGKFSLRQVEDSERGRCLELELHGNPALSDYVGEYATLQPGRPAILRGATHTLGLWVKGNASWGKVVFEFEDTAGDVWRTHAGEWHDWQGELSINFEGWHLIRFPLDTQSPVIYSSPGGRCQHLEGRGREITYPLRLTRLHVVLNRRALDPTQMRSVVPTIRMSQLGGY